MRLRRSRALAEPALKEDAPTAQTAEQLPVYDAYSVDGDVTGRLVRVNYGVPPRGRGENIALVP
ncbi:MAG TPA: hypothetical protein VF591_17460 [Pyrinomonadaceae bacterium]|jgi:hypothetical protein